MVVAGHVIPLPPFMPNHHYTVLPRLEKAVRLVGPPVVILHRSAVGPSEVPLKHLVIQAYPLVITAQSVYKKLFFVGQDAGEVGAMDSTLSFSRVPSPTVSEVLVAMRLEFLPTKSTHLSVLLAKFPCIAGQAEAGVGVDTIQTGGSIQTRAGLALINISFTVLASVSRCTDAQLFRPFFVAGPTVETDAISTRQQISDIDCTGFHRKCRVGDRFWLLYSWCVGRYLRLGLQGWHYLSVVVAPGLW